MARKKTPHDADEETSPTFSFEADPALFEDADDPHAEIDSDHTHDLYLESVETIGYIDAIEPEGDEEEPTRDKYRVSLHAAISEAAAQQLFSTFVRKGRIRLALLPIDEKDDGFTIAA